MHSLEEMGHRSISWSRLEFPPPVSSQKSFHSCMVPLHTSPYALHTGSYSVLTVTASPLTSYSRSLSKPWYSHVDIGFVQGTMYLISSAQGQGYISLDTELFIWKFSWTLFQPLSINIHLLPSFPLLSVDSSLVAHLTMIKNIHFPLPSWKLRNHPF